MTLLLRISFTHAKKASTSGFTDCCLLSRISCGNLPLQRLSVWKITAILSAASLAICCAGDTAAPFLLFSRFLHIFVYSEPSSRQLSGRHAFYPGCGRKHIHLKQGFLCILQDICLSLRLIWNHYHIHTDISFGNPVFLGNDRPTCNPCFADPVHLFHRT